MIAQRHLRCVVMVVGTLFSLPGWGDDQEAASTQKRVTESGREIPVAFDVDVVVVGGASRAVAAAVAARPVNKARRFSPIPCLDTFVYPRSPHVSRMYSSLSLII